VNIEERAEARFEQIRENALKGNEGADFSAPPEGWCLATIARVAVNAPKLLETLKKIQDNIKSECDVFLYDEKSFHVSLLGCSQREPESPINDKARVEKVQNVVSETLRDHAPVDMRLGRLNLLRNQFFLEVYLKDEEWPGIRSALAESLLGIGEDPIVYSDKEPVHLNLARLTAPCSAETVARLIGSPDNDAATSLSISTVELVVTDFVVTPETLAVVEAFRLWYNVTFLTYCD